MSNVPISDNPNERFHLRWRGRQEGPYPAAVIEEKLASNQIGLLHEISRNGQWVSLRDHLMDRAAQLRASQQAQQAEAERQKLEAEQQADELEAQRKAEQLAEQRRLATLAEAGRQAPPIQPIQTQKRPRSSGLRTTGILLLLGGLVVTAFFYFAFDQSVESSVGRVNNLGRMADRQDGILIGLGLAIVGTIMLVIGSREKN